jgi:hypothetical protein
MKSILTEDISDHESSLLSFACRRVGLSKMVHRIVALGGN